MFRSRTWWGVLAAIALMTSLAQAQYLVYSPQTEPLPGTRWVHSLEYGQLAAVHHPEALTARGYALEILDRDTETARYYRLECALPGALRPADLGDPATVRILWVGRRSLIVKAPPAWQPRRADLVRQVQPLRITTQPAAGAAPTLTPPAAAPVAVTGLLEAIVDSIRLDQLTEHETYLSGEAPYWINGGWDSIMTRYSAGPDIQKAEYYLHQALAAQGLDTRLAPFTAAVFNDIQFAPGNPQVGWLITDGKIFGTANGGQSWVLQHEDPAAPTLWSVFALDAQMAWVVGDGGLILHTADGGTTWQPQPRPTGHFLFGVTFRDAQNGWIAGDAGVILRTSDGGTSWQMQTTPVSDRLYDVYFATDNDGWAVGRSGRIIRTSDGGASWSRQTSGTAERLYGVQFLDAQTGFAVGWSGVLLRTTDGGAQWSRVSVPTAENLYDIDFVDGQTGMIAGWSGVCLGTSDGGQTWTLGASIHGKDAYGLDLIDASTAWSSGEGLVAASTDGGATWVSELAGVPSSALNNVVAVKPGTTYPDQFYMICGHFDSVSEMSSVRAPGADDNASGTAAVLEAARVLSGYDFEYGLMFALWNAEEQGLIGSSHYAADAAARGEQILGVINLDMVAYDSNNDGRIEIHAGNLSASQALGQQMISTINAFGFPLVVDYLTSSSSGASDHASFWSRGYPAVLQIEDFQDFTPFYHRTTDRMSSLNWDYFHANVKLAVATLATLARIDSTTTGIAPAVAATDFALAAPYPNPFNPETTIKFSIGNGERVRLAVYDLLGRRIATLVDGALAAGRHDVRWNGVDDDGRQVASGVYLIRLQSGAHHSARKVVLMR